MKTSLIIKTLFLFGLIEFCLPNLQSEKLLTTWKLKAIDKEDSRRYIYEEVENLNGEYSGYQFFPNGKLIVKQSKSWCPVGETKINYEIVKGKWKMINDSLITLIHPRYGSPIEDKRIVSFVGGKDLVLKFNRKYK